MIDLHNHTPACHHAVGSPREYLEEARRQGVREYGFSEHSPWIHAYPGEPLAPTEPEFRALLMDLEALRHEEAHRPDGLTLRIGIEADYIPEQRDLARTFLRSYPFDYIIGSVHNLGPWIYDHPNFVHQWDERRVDDVYAEYLGLLRDMIAWGEVDILAHLDLPKKFGHLPSQGLLAAFQDLLPLIAESGLVVEVNTAGKGKPIGEFYPSPEIVRELVRLGVPMTLGSDAHSPRQVGQWRGEAMQLLRDCGAREVISFHQRRRIGHRL